MIAAFNKSNGNATFLRSIAGALCAILAMAGVLFAGAAADASEASVPPSEVELADVRALLERFDVPESDQENLLQAVAQGELWDVYRGEAPVSTEQQTIDGIDYTIDRFADGSFRAIGFEIPEVVQQDRPSGPSPRAITGCRVTSGSGYSNATGCQIDGVWGTILLGATNVSYTIAQGNPDRITSTGYGFQKCIVVSCSSPTLVVFEPVEGSGPAYARWQSDISASYASWNVSFQLNVGGDSAWQTNS